MFLAVPAFTARASTVMEARIDAPEHRVVEYLWKMIV
jgi:hypothetical protein